MKLLSMCVLKDQKWMVGIRVMLAAGTAFAILRALE